MKFWLTLCCIIFFTPLFYFWYKEPNQINITSKSTLAQKQSPEPQRNNFKRYHQKWVFDGKEIENLEFLKGQWQYDKKLKALSSIPKNKAVVISTNQPYKRPLLLSYKGFVLIENSQGYNAIFGLFLSKNHIAIYPEKSLNTLYDTFDATPNKKKT